MNFEKKFWQSKKWVSWLIATIILAGILIAALVLQTFTWAMSLFMAAGIIGVTALAIGYILSQKSLDNFMRSIVLLGNKKDEEESDET